MRTKIARLGAVAAAAALLSACSNFFPYITSLDSEKRYLEQDSTVLTEADKRAIVNVNQVNPQQGFVIPNRIVCAEPSPDVAKALSEGISAAVQAEVSGQRSGELQGSRSLAESVAQLGERLGTIQLLRDGFYRACEAYANGAISDTTYAMIVSGTDDAMVTLMASEMAAGAFGRQQAAIGGAATGTTAEVVADQQAVTTNRETLVALKGDEAKLQQQKRSEEAKEEPNQDTIDTLDASIAEKQAQIAATEENLRDAVARSASSSARAVFASSVGSISGQRPEGGSQAVESIHRTFMRSTNLDAFVLACVTALDRRSKGGGRAQGTEFVEVCKQYFGANIPGTPLDPKASFSTFVTGGADHRERMALIESFPAPLLASYLENCGTDAKRNANAASCESMDEILKTWGVTRPQ